MSNTEAPPFEEDKFNEWFNKQVTDVISTVVAHADPFTLLQVDITDPRIVISVKCRSSEIHNIHLASATTGCEMRLRNGKKTEFAIFKQVRGQWEWWDDCASEAHAKRKLKTVYEDS